MFGVLLITIFSIIPLVWWLPLANFSTVPGILLSIGQITALIGTILLAINFILASRFFWIESLFAGLNKVYVVHHWVGALAFSLLLVHPIGVLIGYSYISLDLAIYTIIPSPNNVPAMIGSLSLIILSALMFLTLFIKLPYHLWKLSHQFLGLPLFLAGIHGLLIGSNLVQSQPLKLYIFGWILLGLVCYLIRLFNFRLRLHQYKYMVEKVDIIHNFVIISLKPLAKILKYIPGQFVFVRFKSIGISFESHPFSLAGVYEDKLLTIVSKSLGDYTETLKLLKPGSFAWVEGAYGRFCSRYGKYKRQIWIAGGIGITPFRSMAKDEFNQDLDISLFYAVNQKAEAIFDHEFRDLGARNSNFSYFLWIAEKEGKITAKRIKEKVNVLENTEIYICGPIPMMKSLAIQFNELGIKSARIHTEEFGLY